MKSKSPNTLIADLRKNLRRAEKDAAQADNEIAAKFHRARVAALKMGIDKITKSIEV